LSEPASLPALGAVIFRVYNEFNSKIPNHEIFSSHPSGGNENASTLRLTSAYLMFRRLMVG
jgi:hypothetical protein